MEGRRRAKEKEGCFEHSCRGGRVRRDLFGTRELTSVCRMCFSGNARAARAVEFHFLGVCPFSSHPMLGAVSRFFRCSLRPVPTELLRLVQQEAREERKQPEASLHFDLASTISRSPSRLSVAPSLTSEDLLDVSADSSPSLSPSRALPSPSNARQPLLIQLLPPIFSPVSLVNNAARN
jgi:hypothetical protein